MKKNFYQNPNRSKISYLVVFYFLLLSLLSVNEIQASPILDFQVSGKVVDDNNSPLPGVSITLKGTSIGVATDAEGNYSINIPSSAQEPVLVFSYIGYVSQAIPISNKSEVNVFLKADFQSLSEVVVVGYGTQKVKDLTGSVGIVKVEDAKKTASYDVAKLLQGQVAGVTVQSDGQPGGFVNIKIRGMGSLTNNNPLWVVDGVLLDSPYDFNPNDIEAISVLKDATSAAIYGSRGMNGVVIITTKKGKSGAMKVDYNTYAGMQNITKRLDVMNRVQYQQVTSAAELNAGLGIAPANDPTSPSYISNVDTDWQKEGFKTGYIQDHNLNMSGGSENLRANVSLGYFNNSSTVTGPQNYKRYTFNNNITGKKGKFTFGGKINYTNSEKIGTEDTRGHAVFGGAVTSLVTAIPTMPVYDPNRLGGYGGADKNTQRAITLNAVGMNALLKGTTNRQRFVGSVYGEYQILKNLKYKLQLSADRTDAKYLYFEPKYDLGFYYQTPNAYLYDKRERWFTTLVENTMTYNIEAGKHKIDFLAGYTFQNNTYTRLEGSATGLVEPYVLNLNTAVTLANGKTVSGWDASSSLVSFLGRINYNFNDKYLLTANYRRDGSSKFIASHRFGNFASFGAAWNIHNEITLPEFITTMKLRAGYGTLGNQQIDDYLTSTFINTNEGYVFGGVLAAGASRTTVVDPSLKWETKTTSNVALEVGLLRDKLFFSVEYFNNKSNDVLVGIPIPTSVGSTNGSVTTNAGSLRNSGIEFQATYRHQEGDLKFEISANAHTLKNTVLSLGAQNSPIYGSNSKTEVGQPVGQLFGYISDGLFQSNTDVSNHATQTNAAPGDVKFKDLNNDGVITSADRAYLGNAIPKFYFGTNFSASYKNFDLSLFFQGSGGNKVYNGVRSALMGEQYSNGLKEVLNYWTPDNTNTNIPRPIIGDPNSNGRTSDRFVESGTYVRLQNAQLGYSIPSTLVSKIKLSKLRIYISGQNIFKITAYKGYDPDFNSNDGLFSRGFDYGSYPNPRGLMAGLQVGF